MKDVLLKVENFLPGNQGIKALSPPLREESLK